MSKEFKELDAEAKKSVLQEIAAVLKDNGLENVPITQAREMVYNASAKTFEDNITCSIDKELPVSDKAKVDKVKEALKPIFEKTSGINCEISAKIGAGDQYDTITGAKKLGATDSSDLVHDGRPTLIDFWATWCPPCQQPMQHNVDMLEKNPEWNDTVRIIGLSIDQTMDAVDKHVQDKKWESVEHWHRDKSDCSKVYSVQGVPHVMLLDKSGKIVFKGHPATRKDLEQDLKDLAAGKELTGEGVPEAKKAEAADDSKADAIPEGFTELEKEKVDEECAQHKTAMEEFQKNEELAKHAKDCPRAFCVIVVVENYYPSTGKTYFKYDNYRVVVGPKDNIEQLKTIFADKMKGSFNPVIREQAL